MGLGNWTDISHKTGCGAVDVRRYYLEHYCAGVESSCEVKRTEVTMTHPGITLQSDELKGYMPLRSDFDIEHDDGAELLVADMELRSEENVADRAIKHRMLQIYDCNLQERDRRKRFVIDNGVIGIHEENKWPRCGLNATSKARVFARFQTSDKTRAFFTGLSKAGGLRKRLADLRT